MTPGKSACTYFYPLLGSVHDLWFLRIGGAGMGNGFYHYFHAMALAEKHGGRVISPPWFSLKLGTILRRERSKRFYFNIFKPALNEISGFDKLFTLLADFSSRHIVCIDGNSKPQVKLGKINVVSCRKFTFDGLYEYRETIRNQLLAINNTHFSVVGDWGGGGFIGVHVRLGDFTIAKNNEQMASVNNTRISMEWYENITRCLRIQYPDMPIKIFSDGTEEELKSLMMQGTEIYQTGSDIGDLLALSSSSILVGSNSTYSYWAAFLGDMPSVWLEGSTQSDKPLGNSAPMVFAGLSVKEIVL